MLSTLDAVARHDKSPTVNCWRVLFMMYWHKFQPLTYLFIWKTMLQSVILLWKCAFRDGMSVSVLICITRPLPVYPIVFRHPWLPVGGKYSVFNLSSCALVPVGVVNLATCVCIKSEEEGPGGKKPSPIFWIWTAIPSSTTRCHFYMQHL